MAPSRSTASRKSAAASGSSCEVGSSSSSRRGSSASADARQTRWSSPPESSTVFRPHRWSASTASSARSTRGQISAGGDAQVLEPERDLVRDDRHHDLVLGILEDRRDRPSELGRAGAARVQAGDDDPARERAAVEVRHEPGERAQQRRLAGARGPEQRDHLSRLELERDAVERRPAPRIRERQPADRSLEPLSATSDDEHRRQRETQPVPPAPGGRGARVDPARPKPRASIASARFVARSSEPATSGESSVA